MSDLTITRMGVGGVQHLIERAYRESGPLQFVREFFKNALEAGATRIEFFPEWQSAEKHGVFRLQVSDNGRGMTPDQIEAFLNTFGGGGKPIGDAHENFGIGAKTSTLPWNHQGVVVASWTPETPQGVMLWLCRDSKTGEYGARQFHLQDGTFDNVVAPFDDLQLGIDWRCVRPDWIQEKGTVVVCLGNSPNSDTYLTKGGDDDPFGVLEIAKYLNTRVWDLPSDLDVVVTERLSKDDRAAWKTRAGWNRRAVRGARHFIEYPENPAGRLGAKGSVGLRDGTQIDWYLWNGQRPKLHGYASTNGYIAALYDQELYDIKTHHSSFRRFGITHAAVRENLTLIARPPRLANGAGVYPDTARTSLRIKGTRRAGAPLPWDEWGEEFAHNLPEEIVAAVLRAMPSSDGTLEDEKWRDRLAERFGTRWQRSILQPDAEGTDTLRETEGVSGALHNRPMSVRGLRRAEGTDSGEGGASGAGEQRSSQSGSAPAARRTALGGVPKYRWVQGDELEEAIAAAWSPPSSVEPTGVVLMNAGFEPFKEVIKHWKDQYPEHFGETIEKTVREVYGQSMVARIAHSEALVRTQSWGHARVEKELRSPSALTMAALGLINEDHIIASRLGGLLSSKRK